MPTPSEVILDHKQHFLSRLLNRSPLLYFFPGAARIDLPKIFTGIVPNTPALHSATNPTISSATSAENLLINLWLGAAGQGHRVLGISKKNIATLEKIRLQAEDARHVSGQHVLFIGYPLLYAPVEGKSLPVLAPLFFLAITLKCDGTGALIARLSEGEDGQVDVRANLILAQWAEIELNIKLNLEAASALLSEQDWTAKSPEKLASVITQAVSMTMEHWLGLDGRGNLNLDSLDDAPTRDTAKQWMAEGRPAQILNSAVLGVAEFKGQALLADLGALEQQAKNADNDLGLLNYFVKAGDKNLLQGEAAKPAFESDKCLVCESDPSQEQVVWQHRQSPLTVIQGPPGTGKSQTIVNLIADALAHQQSVAVFCQKRAALEVIQKRLAAAKLGDLCVLIDDPVKQRAEVIKNIRGIEIDFQDADFATLRDRRAEHVEKIEMLESQLDSGLRAFHFQGHNKRRYADCQARLMQLNAKRFYRMEAWSDLVRTVRPKLPSDWRMWQHSVEIYRGFSQQILDCCYYESPWRAHRLDISFNQNTLEYALQDVLNFLEKMPVISALHSPLSLHWLTTQLMALRQVQGFLATPQREAQNTLTKALSGLQCLMNSLERGQKNNWVEDAYRGELDQTEFDCLNQHIHGAGNVWSIRKQMYQDDVARILESSFGDYAKEWPKLVEAAAYYVWLDDLKQTHGEPYTSVAPIKNKLGLLSKHLQEKQQNDCTALRRTFSARMGPRNYLDSQDLLRLRGNKKSGTKKTELRDIYVNGFASAKLLHPVLLCSPDVACTMLPLQSGVFDLVIIDEASQMHMAEALPLLYRAKKAVIAGDSKQMPPSDFFASSESSDSDWYDEDEIDEDDAPPVTTEHRLIAAAGEYCLLDAAENSLPKGAAAQRMLEIHYRSAAKELIEFSNHAFYDGKLQAPPGNPSADVMFNRPIRYQKVQGQFKSGINRIEATQIVNFLKELWKIPDSPSVGVIVFNMKQKGELEQQIEELASHEEAFKERWLNERERMHEGEDVGFFVRSVEHVQGDERELIILGTTYAGDSRNFGPLTKKDKGRKRLNVAITRAKRGMLVFSSLNLNAMASDAGSDKEGWFLQQFLRYAKAVSDNDSGSMNAVLNAVNPARTQEQREQQFDSPFEQDVAEFLAQHNYTVDTQIGESGFRIDLGVRRTQGGGYLCGIECDGAQYHSGWRARTNDIWRQRILESKGWEIIRIWSTDWFNDLEKEKRRVLHEINACSEEMKKSMQSLEDILAMASGAEQLPLIEKYVHPTIMPTKQAELGALEIPIFGDLFSVTSQMPLNDAESKILFVEVGDTVTYCDTHHVDEKIQVQITSGRSNFDQGIINQSAPLAGILIDAVVGEEVELRLPGKSPCVLRILKIERVKC